MMNDDDFAPHPRHDRRRGGPGFVRAMGGPRFLGGPEAFFGERGPRGARRARRGLVRDSVLKLLAEQPRNGYQLMTELAERTLGDWQPSPGAIYPCLSQLADEGLIESAEADGQKVFRLTESGRAAAEALPEAPWAGAASEPADEAALQTLWGEFRRLAKTLHLASEQATPAQLATLTADVAALRRQVFTLLAAAPDDQ